MATHSAAGYSEKNIERHAGLLGIRKKPGPYIGPNDSGGLWTCWREPGDNAVDQALAGRNKLTWLVADPLPNKYWVIDSGPGIPVGKKVFEDERGRKESLSTLYVVTGLTHSGSHFSGDDVSRGCLIGSTKIELVDGRIITMADLYREHLAGQKNYVWAVDRKTGHLRAQPVENVQLTKRTRELVKLKLDTGDTVTCTPDHPLYNTALDKVKANKARGQSLISANFFDDGDGYRITGYTKACSSRLNRVVADYYGLKIENRQIHHRDEDKKNNTPNNLQSLTPRQHYAKHPEKISMWMDYVTRTAGEKAELLTKMNQNKRFTLSGQRSKVLRTACRVLHEGLPINRVNYEAFKGHSYPGYVKALNLFKSKDRLCELAQALLTQAEDWKDQRLNKAKRFFAALDYVPGLSNNSMVYDVSESMAAKRIIGKVVSGLKIKKTTTPLELDKLLPGKIGGRGLCQWIDLEEFISAVSHNHDPLDFVYEDLSLSERLRRQHKWDKDLADSRSKSWDKAAITRLANDYLRKLNAMIADGQPLVRSVFHERYKNACGKSSWYTGRAACRRAGLNDKLAIRKAARKANHKVVKVTKLFLDKPVPVYDLTVPVDHNYRLACGIFVGNTHGIGIKATNAMSKRFVCYTFRDGKWWCIEYRNAKVFKNVHVSKPPKLPHGIKVAKGTVIEFEPDLSLFVKHSKINQADVDVWCELNSYLVGGMRVKFTSSKGKTQEWVSKNGPADFIAKRQTELKATPLGRLFEHRSKLLDVAISFTDAEGPNISAYTNGLLNKDGGEHVKAVQDAMVKSLLPFKGKLEYTPTDLLEGLVGLVNAKLAAPKFNNQPKDKLIDERVYDPALKEALVAWQAFWTKNKTLATQVVRRASELRAKTNDFLKDKKLIKTVKGAQSRVSAKLADIVGNAPIAKRELYLVEGDSAGGCFVGSTTIQLINGETKTLKQLVDDAKKGIINYGYAHSNKTGVHVVPIDQPRLVKHTKLLTEVTLDNGAILRCTRDHAWKMRDGSYCRADKLQAGSSLMPHYERLVSESAGERRQIWHPHKLDSAGKALGRGKARGRWQFLHQLVASDIPELAAKKTKLQEKGIKINVHHRDFDTLNDHPSNLRVMDEKKHRTLHAKLTSAFASFAEGDENVHAVLMRTNKKYRKRVIKATKKTMTKYWSSEKHRKAQAKRTTKHMSVQANRDQISASVKLWWSPKRRRQQAERARLQSNSAEYQQRRIFALAETRKRKFLEIAAMCQPLNFKTFDKAMRSWMETVNTPRIPLKQGFLAWREFFGNFAELETELETQTKAVTNHKVVAVRNIKMEQPVPMYDASISRYRNYALAAGVYVHNTSKKARDKSFQAVIPLRGKPVNVMEASKDKINGNKELADILAALGVDMGSDKPLAKLRYGRIIFLADPDVDGKHINCLLIALFWKYLPDLFKTGQLYLVRSPLFMARQRGKIYFGMTKAYIYKQAGNTKLDITRIKGWGEINPDDMQIAFDPKQRRLIRLLPPRNAQGAANFAALMKGGAYRQKFILNMRIADTKG